MASRSRSQCGKGLFSPGRRAVFHLWQQSLGLVGILGLLAHWGGPFLLAFATYVFAVHEFRGRHLEAWGLVLLHYRRRPKVFVWCSILEESTMATAPSEEETSTNHHHNVDDEENEEL